jgi:hypothetical protein
VPSIAQNQKGPLLGYPGNTALGQIIPQNWCNQAHDCFWSLPHLHILKLRNPGQTNFHWFLFNGADFLFSHNDAQEKGLLHLTKNVCT